MLTHEMNQNEIQSCLEDCARDQAVIVSLVGKVVSPELSMAWRNLRTRHIQLEYALLWLAGTDTESVDVERFYNSASVTFNLRGF